MYYPLYRNRTACKALNKMYCKEEECEFYKSGKEYNEDGTLKQKKRKGKLQKGWG